MSTSSSVFSQVVLRHRAAGYLRFDLPPGLCAGGEAQAIQAALGALPGVYRASLYPDHDKLAVRFHPALCDERGVARALAGALVGLGPRGAGPACERCATRAAPGQAPAPAPGGLKARVMGLAPVRWVQEKAQAMRQTRLALEQLSRARFKRVPALLQDPERAVHDFLTDVLVLYLIKTHWERITQIWLRSPWTYRYQWLAVFYLTYLMVRARRRGR
jgi:hypothetical protein